MKTLFLSLILTLLTTTVGYAHINITIDSEVQAFNPPAQLVSERTMLPMRAVFYAIEPGVELNWQPDTMEIQVLTPHSDVIYLAIDRHEMVINTHTVSLDVAPQLIEGVTFVPVRAVAEALGATVAWDEATSTVAITRRELAQDNEHPSYVFQQHITLQHMEETLVPAALEQELFQLLNQLRQEHGLAPFVWHEALAQAARAHSQDMVDNNFIGHTGSDGATLGQRMQRQGLHPRSYAENVSLMQQTATQVMEGWYNSPSHRENLLRDMEYVGIGVQVIPHETFQLFAWTQKLMTP